MRLFLSQISLFGGERVEMWRAFMEYKETTGGKSIDWVESFFFFSQSARIWDLNLLGPAPFLYTHITLLQVDSWEMSRGEGVIHDSLENLEYHVKEMVLKRLGEEPGRQGSEFLCVLHYRTVRRLQINSKSVPIQVNFKKKQSSLLI